MTDEIPLREIWRPEMEANLEFDYRMGHRKRGKAIIFNHFQFAIPGMLPRRGTDLDRDMFCRILLMWGFEISDIMVRNDLTYDSIMGHLYELAKLDHTDHDMFVCAIFTHGERNQLYSFDTLYPAENIWEHFTEDNCPSLRGKPKLFFVQACRGIGLDSGVYVQHVKKAKGVEEITTKDVTNVEKEMKKMRIGSSDDENPLKTIAALGELAVGRENEGISVVDSNDFGPADEELLFVDEPKFLERRGSAGSIQSIPEEWQRGRSNSAEAELPFVREKSLWQLVKLRTRGKSECEDNEIWPLTKLQAGRRSSAPINKIPAEWYETENEDLDSKNLIGEEPFQVPHTEPDVLIAFSTADGYYSFRRPTDGSWFIQVLYKVVASKISFDKLNLLDILTEVNQRVAFDMESFVNDPRKKAYDQRKQISTFNSTLTKHVYFTKKTEKT